MKAEIGRKNFTSDEQSHSQVDVVLAQYHQAVNTYAIDEFLADGCGLPLVGGRMIRYHFALLNVKRGSTSSSSSNSCHAADDGHDQDLVMRLVNNGAYLSLANCDESVFLRAIFPLPERDPLLYLACLRNGLYVHTSDLLVHTCLA